MNTQHRHCWKLTSKTEGCSTHYHQNLEKELVRESIKSTQEKGPANPSITTDKRILRSQSEMHDIWGNSGGHNSTMDIDKFHERHCRVDAYPPLLKLKSIGRTLADGCLEKGLKKMA